MHRPIRVDNSHPATVWDTARTLGVSKKRTLEIIREVRRMLHKDAKTGEIVIRTTRPGKKTARSRNDNAKTYKASARRKAAR